VREDHGVSDSKRPPRQVRWTPRSSERGRESLRGVVREKVLSFISHHRTLKGNPDFGIGHGALTTNHVTPSGRVLGVDSHHSGA
jgi:hypothetical protein